MKAIRIEPHDIRKYWPHVMPLLKKATALSPGKVVVADILSQELGRPVEAKAKHLETWREQAKAAGLGDYQVETLTRMFDYYQRFDFLGNSQVLSWLLKRSPTSFSNFVKRTIRERLQEEGT